MRSARPGTKVADSRDTFLGQPPGGALLQSRSIVDSNPSGIRKQVISKQVIWENVFRHKTGHQGELRDDLLALRAICWLHSFAKSGRPAPHRRGPRGGKPTTSKSPLFKSPLSESPMRSRFVLDGLDAGGQSRWTSRRSRVRILHATAGSSSDCC